jgi:RimJ/RimL family protein N-acetyltransferase
MSGGARPTAAQAALVKALKAGEQQAEILVRSPSGEILGTIEPITLDLATECPLHKMLSRWRAENMTAFLTVFQSTPEKTAGFLVRVSLPSPSRLLCVLRDAAGTLVGNIGLCNIAEGSAELDNVLRGERIGASGFMRCATSAFLGWSFGALDLHEIYLHVLEDNVRAIRLYEAVGFQRGKRLPLWRRETTEGYDLLRAETPDAVPISTRLLQMTLSHGLLLTEQKISGAIRL